MESLDDIIEDVNKNIKKVFLAGVAPEFRQEAYIIGLKLTLDRLAREVEFAQKDDCSSKPASPEHIFNIPELLEQVLHFLAIDKSLYPALFVCQHWYRCGAPILWERIELKGNEAEDFEKSIDPTGEALKLMAKSYPNLKYLNISALYNRFRPKNDIDLTAIANSCNKLEYLNISNRTEFSEISISRRLQRLLDLNLRLYSDPWLTRSTVR
ncbi:18750_t:CDS:2, partial [Acaulospora morrowiae]